MRYGSVCSGIEAATVAWEPLGWKPAFFSEIAKLLRAVLMHHYPHVPLHGDFTTIRADQYGAIDLLVGGTPCTSFSIAGHWGGSDDERGNPRRRYGPRSLGGAGTTGLVADRLQRGAILIELNPQYVSLARKRIAADRGPLSDLFDCVQQNGGQ